MVAGIFPLPRVEIPLRVATSRSHRLHERHRRRASIATTAQSTIDALNNLSVSFNQQSVTNPQLAALLHLAPGQQLPASSDDWPLPKHRGPQATSSATQKRFIEHVQRCAQRFHRRRTSVRCGVDSSLNVDIKHLVQPSVLSAGYSKTQSAVSLVDDRVALPDIAGEVDLLSSLPPATAALYSALAACMRPMCHLSHAVCSQRVEPPSLEQHVAIAPSPCKLHHADAPPSRPRVYAAAGEYIKLLRHHCPEGGGWFIRYPKTRWQHSPHRRWPPVQ
jgi:hypothetical protein